jgi:glucan-binding YG repeat protein
MDIRTKGAWGVCAFALSASLLFGPSLAFADEAVQDTTSDQAAVEVAGGVDLATDEAASASVAAEAAAGQTVAASAEQTAVEPAASAGLSVGAVSDAQVAGSDGKGTQAVSNADAATDVKADATAADAAADAKASGSASADRSDAAGTGAAANSSSADSTSDKADSAADAADSALPRNGWATIDGNTYYYKNGARVTGEQYIKDDDSNEWHWYYFWAGANGAMQTEWSWIESLDKWCYYNEDGQMQYGQQCINDLWYRFDTATGEVTRGFAHIDEEDKWVFYDRVMSYMLYGQQYIDEGWYYLTPVTGAVDYEWSYLPDDNKWVYYDSVSGRMLYGQQLIDGSPHYFDLYTGRVYTEEEEINLLLSVVYDTYGADLDCIGDLAAAGGDVCYEGPCMSYVWWCFRNAGLDLFLCDGAISGWPHHNYDWYDARDRITWSPKAGDIAFFRYSGWADDIGASASHAGVVIGATDDAVLVVDALTGGFGPVGTASARPSASDARTGVKRTLNDRRQANDER